MNCYFVLFAGVRSAHYPKSVALLLMNSVSSSRMRALGLAALLAVLAPRGARAENSISYKYEDYQEDHGRIAVQTHGVHVEQDLNADTHLKLDGILDAITGATPTGEPAPT